MGTGLLAIVITFLEEASNVLHHIALGRSTGWRIWNGRFHCMAWLAIELQFFLNVWPNYCDFNLPMSDIFGDVVLLLILFQAGGRCPDVGIELMKTSSFQVTLTITFQWLLLHMSHRTTERFLVRSSPKWTKKAYMKISS